MTDLLRVSGLALDYGSKRILEDVSLELKAGRILAMIGANGAGKSSTMRILAGLVKPLRGQLHFRGLETDRFRDLRNHAGYLIESPSFYSYLSGKKNLDLLRKLQPDGPDSLTLLRLVGLEDAADKAVNKYSKGMKQRLGIAQALLGNPSILILDEPFHGLDPEVKQSLMELIRNLAHREDKAILISSHLLEDMVQLADDFILLHEGRVHFTGQIADYQTGEQAISFHFREGLRENALPHFPLEKLIRRDTHQICLRLTPEESEELIGRLCEFGLPPFKVEQANLLLEKYMEIAG